jgi:preprotein translocase subunit SecD
VAGSVWLKFSTIFAIVLSSLYILAPTIIDVSGDSSELAAEAAELSMTTTNKGPGLESRYVVEGADVGDVLEEVRTTLTNANIPVANVLAKDSLLVVQLRAGGITSQVQTLLENPAPIQSAECMVDGLSGAELAACELDAVSAYKGATISRKVAEVVEARGAQDDEVSNSWTSSLPLWFTNNLPNTAMNLGLDLQGGVDLTLQIELEEAVRARVGRDLSSVLSSLQDGGFAAADVQRDRFEAALLIHTEKSISKLQSFMASTNREYVYRDSPTNSDGVLVHAFVLKDEARTEFEEQAIEQVLETLRQRVDETGVKEPSIVKKSGGRINVQMPGKVDLEAALKAIGTTAVLEFRMVDEEFEDATLQRIVSAAEKALPPEQFNHDKTLDDWLHDQGKVADDRMVMWSYAKNSETGEDAREFPYALKSAVVLTGANVNSASMAWDQNQQPYVSMEFKAKGAEIFCQVTTDNVKKRFAIILDDQIRSAPSIREKICGGSASIEMGGSVDAVMDAKNLALVLRTGSLTAPVSIGEIRTIGSTLGADAIQSGTRGGMAGAILVLLFMALWYRSAGLVADVALTINVVMVFAVLSLFGATLTLPGIAGVALTVGMAVDANIIIFERIREEMRLGQHARKAVETGFEKAAVAVIDANITTAIAGVVLYSYGTGPIKGFAVTLLVGIGTTLITALFVTRTFLEFLTRNSNTRFRI